MPIAVMCFMAKGYPDILCHEICRVVTANDFADRQHPPGFLLLSPQVINLYMAYSRYASTLDHAIGSSRVYVHSGLKLHAEVTGQS